MSYSESRWAYLPKLKLRGARSFFRLQIPEGRQKAKRTPNGRLFPSPEEVFQGDDVPYVAGIGAVRHPFMEMRMIMAGFLIFDAPLEAYESPLLQTDFPFAARSDSLFGRFFPQEGFSRVTISCFLSIASPVSLFFYATSNFLYLPKTRKIPSFWGNIAFLGHLILADREARFSR